MSFDQKDWRQMRKNVQLLLKKEFPNINDDVFAELKKISLYVWIFPDGSCRCDCFSVPKTLLSHYDDLESDLANLVREIEKMDFKQYKMIFTSPENEKESLCRTFFPFLLLKQELK